MNYTQFLRWSLIKGQDYNIPNEINLNDLDKDFSKSFYWYRGSNTIPPCEDGVDR